mgnify:CR=1 FL=1
MAKTRAFVCLVSVAVMVSAVLGEEVATTITLKNSLDLPRENELVTVKLSQFTIPENVTFQSVDVIEGKDNQGIVLPSQFDDLLKDGIDGDDEVSFLVSLPPDSSKVVINHGEFFNSGPLYTYEGQADYSRVAYWYQIEPHEPAAYQGQSVEDRLPLNVKLISGDPQK